MTTHPRRHAAPAPFNWKKESFKDAMLKSCDWLASARALTFDRPTRSKISALMRRIHDLSPR